MRTQDTSHDLYRGGILKSESEPDRYQMYEREGHRWKKKELRRSDENSHVMITIRAMIPKHIR